MLERTKKKKAKGTERTKKTGTMNGFAQERKVGCALLEVGFPKLTKNGGHNPENKQIAHFFLWMCVFCKCSWFVESKNLRTEWKKHK